MTHIEIDCLIAIALASAKHFSECSCRWLVAVSLARHCNIVGGIAPLLPLPQDRVAYPSR